MEIAISAKTMVNRTIVNRPCRTMVLALEKSFAPHLWAT